MTGRATVYKQLRGRFTLIDILGVCGSASQHRDRAKTEYTKTEYTKTESTKAK